MTNEQTQAMIIALQDDFTERLEAVDTALAKVEGLVHIKERKYKGQYFIPMLDPDKSNWEEVDTEHVEVLAPMFSFFNTLESMRLALTTPTPEPKAESKE